MHPIIRTYLIAALMVLCACDFFAQSKVTVHGTVVELTSYIREGIIPTSPGKMDIAKQALSNGGTLAIVENRTTKVYVLASPLVDSTFVGRISPYLGLPSFVKGTAKTRGGVRVVWVEDIGKSLAK